jgi:outer membrane protein OmpA-like peptidoglycan-associated protein
MKPKILLILLFLSTISFSQKKIEVFFNFNEHTLNPPAITMLNNWIASNENIEVSKIYGYCDWVGSNQYNDSLSIRRANEVFLFLKDKQIAIKPDYQIKGFGEDFEQFADQSLNRKVTIEYESTTVKPKVEPQKEFTEAIKKAKAGDKIKLKNINFFNNSARVVPKSIPILYELLCVMEENPTLKIEIQGHICCQPIKDISNISTARARAVYNYLVQHKIDRNRMKYKGYGVTNPIYKIPENNEFEENENRRVEILILEK